MQDKKDKIIKELYSLHRFGIKPGLERTFQLLEQFKNPHNELKAIHVAGTNGKGAVCSILASILKESGFHVGLYTSPHLVKFNERIRIDGKPINDTELIRLAEPLLKYGRNLSATFFEITTVLAFQYFIENKVDIAVIETGMGGRFDSTNVVQPIVSIITEIGLDHQEYLGSTIEEIAFEKAGIIKNNTPVVVSSSSDAAIEVIQNKASAMNAEIYYSDKIEVSSLELYKDLSMKADFKSKNYYIHNLLIKNAGIHQLNNVKTALLSINLLKDNYRIDEITIRKGFENIRQNTGYIGRIDMLSQNPPFVLDVSHNPAGILSLVDTLNRCGGNDMRWNIIFAAMSDKDIPEMLNILAPYCKTLYPVMPDIERAATAAHIADMAKESGIQNIIIPYSLEESLILAFNKNLPILATGSFYLAGELLPLIEKFYIIF